MREIKFRAFEHGEMTYSHNNEINHGNDQLQWFFRVITRKANIMQYTGLKDKNGKEVYEGDIVKCSKGCPHEIIWEQEYGGTYTGGMPTWYLSGLNVGYAWTGEEEIIGNVYENYKLLKPSA